METTVVSCGVHTQNVLQQTNNGGDCHVSRREQRQAKRLLSVKTHALSQVLERRIGVSCLRKVTGFRHISPPSFFCTRVERDTAVS